MSNLPNRPLPRIIRADHAQSWIDGFAFLESAKAYAAELRAQVQEEVAQAREAGRLEGRRAGEAEAAILLARTHAEIDRHLASLETRICDLALEVVRMVLGTFSDVELVARASRRALTVFREQNGVVVSVAPEMADEVARYLAGLELGSLAARVEPDRHLSARQCMVTTPSSSIDVGIDAQLGAVRDAMIASAEGVR